MAGRKHNHAYRFLPVENNVVDDGVIGSDEMDELEESDVWGLHVDAKRQDERTNYPIPQYSSNPKKAVSMKVGACNVGAARSLPVNVPHVYWSKMLGDQHGGRSSGMMIEGVEGVWDEEDEVMGRGSGGGRLIPPHEYLCRQRRLSGVASMSVHEGVGRTLKGRDLRRVRNAVWEKIGFQD